MSYIRKALMQYLEGAAYLFDFAGALFPSPKPHPEHRRIAQALESDWKMIGCDMRRALERFERQHSEGQK